MKFSITEIKVFWKSEKTKKLFQKRWPSFTIVSLISLFLILQLQAKSNISLAFIQKLATEFDWQMAEDIPCVNPIQTENFYYIEFNNRIIEFYYIQNNQFLLAKTQIKADSGFWETPHVCNKIKKPSNIREI